MTSPTDDLARLVELSEKATQGEWHWDSDPVKGDPTGRIRYRICTLGKTITHVYYSSFEGGQTTAKGDSEFIAALVNWFRETHVKGKADE